MKLVEASSNIALGPSVGKWTEAAHEKGLGDNDGAGFCGGDSFGNPLRGRRRLGLNFKGGRRQFAIALQPVAQAAALCIGAALNLHDLRKLALFGVGCICI
eukprot:6203942-Pleurochrysis_carterae.AAC.3